MGGDDGEEQGICGGNEPEAGKSDTTSSDSVSRLSPFPASTCFQTSHPVTANRTTVSWKMDLESAQALGACTPYIGDMEGFMKNLKEREIYTIARIACFKDPCLADNGSEHIRRYHNLFLMQPFCRIFQKSADSLLFRNL